MSRGAATVDCPCGLLGRGADRVHSWCVRVWVQRSVARKTMADIDVSRIIAQTQQHKYVGEIDRKDEW